MFCQSIKRTLPKIIISGVLLGIFSLPSISQCVNPDPPVIGTITQPDCSVRTGSIEITGLPSAGTWTLTRFPGNVQSAGSGTSVTVTGLDRGTYSFTVGIDNCTSDRSADAVIDRAPEMPSAPAVSSITQPTCQTSTGSIALSGLPSGTWTLTINPGGSTREGSGTTTTLTGLSSGTYSFTVTNAVGCTSASSSNAVINAQPQTPTPPIIGTTTQPTCETPTGSVVLNGLPDSGTWTLTRYPGAVERTGTGAAVTISGLAPETYYWTVTNSGNCTSGNSASVTLNDPPSAPSAPAIGTITQPTCDVRTGIVNLSGLPSSGSWIVTLSPGGRTIENSGTTLTVTDLAPATYTFRVTNSIGCTSAPSEQAVINNPPVIPSNPSVRVDCFLGNRMAILTVTSPVGSGYEYSLDGGAYSTERTFMNVDNGNHTISVRSAGGCITTGDPFAVSCGCVNRPSLTLSSRSGSVCGITPLTVTGNTFGGSATSVTITENGGGSVSQEVINASPFVINYTPVSSDIGNVVTITITTNNPLGSPCEAAVATYSLTVRPVPSSPVPGQITHPSCTSSTGSVVLSGLPSSGNWSLTRTPGNVTTQGSGATTTLTGISSGTYTFTVSSNGCQSQASAAIVINPQPAIPAAPVAGTLVQPTCVLATGTINLNGLPSAGNWTLTRYPGMVTTTGTGTSASIPALPAGTYNFTVTSSSGCVSPSSANIVINPQPATPGAPLPGAITAPTCAQPQGSVVLSGLPVTGRWTVNSIPAGITLSGNGGSAAVGGLVPGAYTFTVTSSAGCTSAPTGIVLIPPIPDAPVLTVTDPLPVCSPSTVDITAPAITAGSTEGVTLTYWTNQIATNQYATPSTATSGTYYIKATNPSQCIAIKPVHVTVLNPPVVNAGPDQELNYLFTANVAANTLAPGETGSWSVFEGTGSFADPASPVTTVDGLSEGNNIFIWKVTNAACPEVIDSLKIRVKDLTIPTLITPNEDGINDYFILNGIEAQRGNELIIFDRRGVMVFKDTDYINDWNGTDYNGRYLADDTYFFVLKIGNGKQRSGFIVIRR